MDERDQELLDRQLKAIYPAPRAGGALIMAVLVVFAAGIAVGGLAVEYKAVPARMAMNTATFAMTTVGDHASGGRTPPSVQQ